MESILGAIFVDSGDLSACEIFVERLGLLPLLRRFLDDAVDVVHPMNIAQRLSRSDVKFSVLREVGMVDAPADGDGDDDDDSEDPTAQASYTCTVTLPGYEDIVVRECFSREEAEVRAADAAVAVLRETASLWE